MRYFTDQNERKRGKRMKMNFECFQTQKWMLQTVRAEKVDKNMESFVCFPCSLPKLWSLNCLKKCIFWNFVLASARNLSLFRQFTYMHLKGLVTQFHKIVLFITLWRTVLEIIGFRVEEFCYISVKSASFFIFLIANISWTMARTPKNHILFWKSVMRTSRCIYVNCFRRLTLLAEVSTKFQKMHFFGHFKDHNSRRKHRN